MLSLLLIFLASLLFSGIIGQTKALLSGRRGPRLWQPVFDWLRLLGKGSVFSRTSSAVFRIAPAVYFSSVLFASLFVPFGGSEGLFSFEGDFVVFAYTLALGKFFMALMALDIGSSFEGMGAGREAVFSMLAEPAFYILMGAFALLTGYTSFYDIYAAFHFSSAVAYALAALAGFVLLLLAAIENSRMPVDDPKTHLELTMVHEVMILDNSGFDLALILYTGALKFAVYGALIAGFFINHDWTLWLQTAVFFAIQAACAVTIACIETFSVRYRMNHNPQFIFTLTSVALLLFFGILFMG